MRRPLVRLVLLGAAALGAIELAARALWPWYSRWGADDEDLTRPWPGDDLSPDAAAVATRAIAIRAPADTVWAWLVQIGQDRAGFYSYTALENLVGARMHNVDRIVDEFQARAVGDIVRLAPPDRYGKIAEQVVASLEPGRHLALVGRNDYDTLRRGRAAAGSWTFVVDPRAGQTTRLVIRSRYRVRRPLFDLVHFVMERGMMRGLKARAEGLR